MQKRSVALKTLKTLKNTIVSIVKPRANGRNIVDQQLPTLLDVTCCVRLHILLHGVGCCCAKFETGQTFRPVQTDATLLAYNSQHCWELLRPFACSLTV